MTTPLQWQGSNGWGRWRFRMMAKTLGTVYKFNGSHCWKFGCRRLSERCQRLEYQDFDNKEVPSNVPLASSSSFFTVARTNFLCTCIQVFRKIYKSTSKFILIIKMYVFIYEAPNMSTETLHFPLDIPKYLITIATYSQTSL